MATITLTVLRCPQPVPMQERSASGGELTLGRGASCDWRLEADSEISKTHCKIEFLAGAWQVRDLSANGTFVNQSTAPIGRDRVQLLFDGDRLQVGSYEFEVHIAEERYPTRNEPVVPRAFGEAAGPAVKAVIPGGWRPDSPPLPGLESRSASSVPDDERTYPQLPDYAGTTREAFPVPRNPPRVQQPIPSDWRVQDPGADTEPAPVATPYGTPYPPRDGGIGGIGGIGGSAGIGNIGGIGGIGGNASISAAPHTPIPPKREAEAASKPPQRPNPIPTPPADAAGATSFAGFAAGLNLAPALMARAAADPAGVLRTAGSLLRAAVTGVRSLLIARGVVKREFRIEQTMLQSANNNPLKFAATDDDALAALLDPRSNSLQAMQEAIDDLTLHQVATLAATQAAARELLLKLAPAHIESENDSSGLLPWNREKRLWESYRRLHARLQEQFEDDFDSAFGKAFARAYEQAAERSKRSG
jgi:predicted component of type VI protein secretion system